MAACVAVGVPVSDHAGGQVVLEHTHSTGDTGDECCAYAHHVVPAPTLAVASSSADPEPPAGIGARSAMPPRLEQESTAPAEQIEGVASIAHPPFYLLYSRLLIPHFS